MMKRDFFDLTREILGYFTNTSNVYPVSEIIDYITLNTHEKKERIAYLFDLLDKNHYILVEDEIVSPTKNGINYYKMLQENSICAGAKP